MFQMLEEKNDVGYNNKWLTNYWGPFDDLMKFSIKVPHKIVEIE